ncbi:SETMR methyltransferase, partial [Acromyrmex insinuator]
LFQKMDQRICIKFCVKNKIKCADAFRMLTVAYGEATLDRSNVYLWYKMFSEGREDVNDEERAGRPSTSTTDENIDEVKKIVLANRRITVREEYYLQVMRNLREAIRQKRPDLWKNKNWLLHHDNAPAHTSLLVREFLAKNNTLMMPQPITGVVVGGVVEGDDTGDSVAESDIAENDVAEDDIITDDIGSDVTENGVIIDVVGTIIIEPSDVSVEVSSVSEDVTIYNRIRKLLVSMRISNL